MKYIAFFMQDEMNGAKFDDAIIRLFPLSLLMNLSESFIVNKRLDMYFHCRKGRKMSLRHHRSRLQIIK